MEISRGQSRGTPAELETGTALPKFSKLFSLAFARSTRAVSIRPGIMTLQTKEVAEITEADIRTLIDNEVQEGKYIDYKRELPGANDSAKKEFLFDVSSFANASGGHLIYGVEEQGGIPKQICGLSVADTDAELRRLQSMILDGIDPRIPGVEARFVPVAGSEHVLIIRVPKSWNPPHMVTLQGVNKFCTRDSAGKHPLDVAELRGLFAIASSLTNQIRSFKAERIGRIIAADTPVTLVAVPKTVLHLIPFQAFTSAPRIHFGSANRDVSHLLIPLGGSSFAERVNLDGLLHYGMMSRECGGSDGYLQLYYNGIVETVDTNILSANVDETLIASAYFERKLIDQIPQYLVALQKLAVSPPFIALLTLIGVKGHRLAVEPRFRGGAPIDRDIVMIPELVFHDYECSPRALRPMLDSIWNAAGWHQSLNFDANGDYVG